MIRNKRTYHLYSEEEKEFLKHNFERFSRRELADIFNKKFDANIRYDTLARYCTAHLKLTSRTNSSWFKKGNIPWNKGKHGYQKIKPPHLFKKGHLPKHTRNLDSERENSSGFIEVKIDIRKTWKLKHHVIYEKYHNVKISKKDKVIFLDGNKRNFNIDNLVKISVEEQIYLAKTKLLINDIQLNKTAINLARLITILKKAEKVRNNG